MHTIRKSSSFFAPPFRQIFFLLVLFAAAVVAVIASGCGGGGSASTTTTPTTMASASVMLSDPATCQAPNGPFEHVYVTVTDVKASVNSAAGANDPSFVDLTPNLAANPMQIDLLGQANNQCFLATLGATTQLQPGNYQQIRIFLADNSTTVANNVCNGSANCVVLNNNSIHPLLLSSESKTGIKISSGQIGNGGFNIASGQTKDLDIDFNTCVSIVQEGNGQYRLKPVLHAGEVTTTSSSINGTVVDSSTGNPINGSVLVALEQKDANGIDRVFMNTLTTGTGAFVFCPLPTGSYDVVIVAESSTGVVYAPVVITGVSQGSSLSVVQLHAQAAGAAGPATLQGQVTTQDTSQPPAGTSADVQLSALEQASSTLTVTIPLLPNSSQSSAMLSVPTASGGGCASGTDCASYSMMLPAATPYVGAFASGGTTLTASAIAASYIVDGIAFVPSSGGTLDCNPSEVKSSAVLPVAGVKTTVGTLAFAGCQAGF
ncbi:MAG: DUF4382 domain-containing protein [Acidobacteriaceae bacterium]